MVKRLVTGSVVGTLMVIAALATTTRVAHANFMAPGDTLTLNQCVYSDNGVWRLCYENYLIHTLVCCTRINTLVWTAQPDDCGLHADPQYCGWTSYYDGSSGGLGRHQDQTSQDTRNSGTAYMQYDGNFAFYPIPGVSTWSTQTGGWPGSQIYMQDDSNLVVYYYQLAIWSWW
jgi:hypothetical protein